MSLLFAFLAGVVTILSPCVLPLLPVILGSSTAAGRLRPIGVIFGFVLFFTLTTLLLSLLVRQLAISPEIHRTAAAVIFIVMGATLAVPPLKNRFELVAGSLGRIGARPATASGFGGGLATGAGLGLAWTPCVGPIMASVITLALNQATTLGSALTAVAFSLGTALPMGLVVLLGARAVNRIGFLKHNAARIQQVSGVLILLVGLAIWFGFDRTIQIELLRTFPNWEAALTGWERSVTGQR